MKYDLKNSYFRFSQLTGSLTRNFFYGLFALLLDHVGSSRVLLAGDSDCSAVEDPNGLKEENRARSDFRRWLHLLSIRGDDHRQPISDPPREHVYVCCAGMYPAGSELTAP